MRSLYFAIKWDFLRQQRYYIMAAAAFVTAIYVVLFQLLPIRDQAEILVVLIFNDPAGMGLLFIGSLYLFEQSENTLQALAVTPLAPWQYLLSKTITLTLLATVCSLVMIFAARGWHFNFVYFTLGISLSAALFTLLGFVLVTKCKSFNEYIMKMAIVMLPVGLPILHLFGVVDWFWIYIIPVQAGILLLKAAITPIPVWEIYYGIIYLSICNLLVYKWALSAYQSTVIK